MARKESHLTLRSHLQTLVLRMQTRLADLDPGESKLKQFETGLITNAQVNSKRTPSSR
jgi:hypothetical protein